METKQNNSIPRAIIIAGAIIAVAIIWSQKPITQATDTTKPAGNQAAAVSITMAPVNSEDHILGNPAAPIKIVEYSDTSCPFCKMFHPTMKQLMDDYGADGKIAWVYRHFPLDKPGSRSDGGILHPNAGNEAHALECAASLGGNDAFWKYTNRLYEITPSTTGQSPNGLDQKELPVIAQFAGLDVAAFNECQTSGKFKANIEADYQDGLSAGVSGTPMSILVLSKPAPKTLDSTILNLTSQLGAPIQISEDRTKIMMGGALPKSAFVTIIDALTQ